MQSIDNFHRKQETYKIGAIYSLARARKIPINEIVRSYVNMSSYDEIKNFTFNPVVPYKTNNAEILKEGREKAGLTLKVAARIIGCSESLICYFEQGKRNVTDIRYLYNFSKLYKIPLYILIRNELGITDKEMKKLVKLEESYKSLQKSGVEDESTLLCNEEISDLFAKIKKLSKSDLQILVFMKIVFHSSSQNNYSKLLNAPKAFDMGKTILKHLDDPIKMGAVNELLKLM